MTGHILLILRIFADRGSGSEVELEWSVSMYQIAPRTTGAVVRSYCESIGIRHAAPLLFEDYQNMSRIIQ